MAQANEIAPPPPKLNYARDQAQVVRKRWIKRAIVIGLLFGVLGIAYVYRLEISLRARRVCWSRACLWHEMTTSSEFVVADPTRGAALCASNPDYIPISKSRFGPAMVYYMPRAWREYHRIEPSVLKIDSDQRFITHTAIAFLGERRTPSGNRRIVMIPAIGQNAHDLLRSSLTRYFVIVPNGLVGSPTTATGQTFSHMRGFNPLTITKCVADPNDASHLTIEYDVSRAGKFDHNGVADVYLQNDDSLRAFVRNSAS